MSCSASALSWSSSFMLSPAVVALLLPPPLLLRKRSLQRLLSCSSLSPSSTPSPSPPPPPAAPPPQTGGGGAAASCGTKQGRTKGKRTGGVFVLFHLLSFSLLLGPVLNWQGAANRASPPRLPLPAAADAADAAAAAAADRRRSRWRRPRRLRWCSCSAALLLLLFLFLLPAAAAPVILWRPAGDVNSFLSAALNSRGLPDICEFGERPLDSFLGCGPLVFFFVPSQLV